jgi:hypothetical protein
VCHTVSHQSSISIQKWGGFLTFAKERKSVNTQMLKHIMLKMTCLETQ